MTKEDRIDQVLLTIYPYIKMQEEEYDLMTKDLVLLLMDLMLLLALELKVYEPSFVYIESAHL